MLFNNPANLTQQIPSHEEEQEVMPVDYSTQSQQIALPQENLNLSMTFQQEEPLSLIKNEEKGCDIENKINQPYVETEPQQQQKEIIHPEISIDKQQSQVESKYEQELWIHKENLSEQLSSQLTHSILSERKDSPATSLSSSSSHQHQMEINNELEYNDFIAATTTSQNISTRQDGNIYDTEIDLTKEQSSDSNSNYVSEPEAVDDVIILAGDSINSNDIENAKKTKPSEEEIIMEKDEISSETIQAPEIFSENSSLHIKNTPNEDSQSNNITIEPTIEEISKEVIETESNEGKIPEEYAVENEKENSGEQVVADNVFKDDSIDLNQEQVQTMPITAKDSFSEEECHSKKIEITKDFESIDVKEIELEDDQQEQILVKQTSEKEFVSSTEDKQKEKTELPKAVENIEKSDASYCLNIKVDEEEDIIVADRESLSLSPNLADENVMIRPSHDNSISPKSLEIDSSIIPSTISVEDVTILEDEPAIEDKQFGLSWCKYKRIKFMILILLFLLYLFILFY